MNHHGSAPSMESAGAKAIFERSIEKRKLCYDKLYGERDSKSFRAVKDSYPRKFGLSKH